MIAKSTTAARIRFLQDYLYELNRIIKAGYDVKGYFLWSFIDNFEWALGYTNRFGLVYVDWTTLKRTRKDSYYFYRDTARNNGFDYDTRVGADKWWQEMMLNPL